MHFLLDIFLVALCSPWVILGSLTSFPTAALAVASLNYIRTQTFLLSIRTAGAWRASHLLNSGSLHMHFEFNISDILLLAPPQPALLFRLINGTMIHQVPKPATQEPSATLLFPLP